MIIGLSGPYCAGTDTVGKILVEKGFVWFSYSDILREEARKRGIELTRRNLQDLGDELRLKQGLGVLSKILIEKMEDGKNYVVGNIRNPGEVEELRKCKDFILVNVDAPKELRFERMLQRGREKDAKTFSDFLRSEERDFGIGQGKHGQQHAAVFEMADTKIINDGTVEELREKVERILKID